MSNCFESSPNFMITSESVTEGHPDKMCDQISDAILDSILEQDPYGRVACEVATTTGMVIVLGEISTKCYIEIPRIVRNTVREIGYIKPEYGFDYQSCGVMVSINEQSSDIDMGVSQSAEAKTIPGTDAFDKTGAGDQGMMVGFACNETPELMPLPISLSHKLCRRLAQVRKDKTLPYLRPDGKSQVTMEYHSGKPKRVDSVVIGAQHNANISHEQIEKDIIENVIKLIVPPELIEIPDIMSMPPAVSSLVDPFPIPDLPGVRFWLILTAASPATVVALFRAKIRQRLTALRLIWHVISPKTSSPPVSLTGWKYRLPMSSASPTRFPSP